MFCCHELLVYIIIVEKNAEFFGSHVLSIFLFEDVDIVVLSFVIL